MLEKMLVVWNYNRGDLSVIVKLCLFVVSGTYEMQIKAFDGRNTIVGPQMLLSVQPDVTKPTSFVMQYALNEFYVADDILPGNY